MTTHHLGTFGDLSLTVLVTSPPWYENCFFVRHVPTGQTVIIDPGNDAQDIQDHLAQQQATPLAIWLTHGHPDHLGAARILEQALDIDTIAHEDELTIISRTDALNRSFTGQGLQPPARVKLFQGEPTLTLAGHPVTVTHTPGHTPGGVVYDFGGFAITGDTLFRQGVGRTDLPGGDEATLWASITRLLERTQDHTQLCAGHGPAWTAADAKRWWAMMA